MQAKRYVQMIAVLGCGLLTLTISLGNVTDYWTNFEFVKHVLLMDTIFPNSTLKYRSIENPIIHHAAYIIIIAVETVMTFFFLRASQKMYKTIGMDFTQFSSSKKDAYKAIGIGIALWFIGFEVIGGEWFCMWQSTAWNGLSSANRIVLFFGLCYIMLAVDTEKREHP